MEVDSLNFCLTKFVQEVAKADGTRYPPRSLYSLITGIQRHLQKCGIKSIHYFPCFIFSFFFLLRLKMFRRKLDAEMKLASKDGLATASKKEERGEISVEDKAALWEKGLLGCQTAKSLLNTIYFYNGFRDGVL
ncbi:uncharacterized protein LOC116602978 [Nematostella vectensis]|uniref:uncharacterized protein LOC116602978 n=1 Tax=Nematostella vectensis TaxID=45351 RepID=UPI0020776032|nr:uncharacterized protein LOC116602978 [Nematostella vectensis]